MGWWKIKDVESGQIDWCSPRESGQLINAVPGQDSKDLLYNGDGPADVMGVALVKIFGLYEEAWQRSPSKEELRACFNFVVNGMYPDHPKEVSE